MATFNTMKNRITSELTVSEYSAEASAAIITSIQFYQVEDFGFNTTRTSTIVSTETLAVPANFQYEQHIKVQRSGNYYHPRKKTIQEIERMRYNDSYTSIPWYYAIHAEKIRFYPAPEQTYSCFISYVMTLPTHSASSSTGWTNQLEELIRMHSKVDLLDNIILGPDAQRESMKFRMREKEVYDRFKTRRVLEGSSGRVRKRGIL